MIKKEKPERNFSLKEGKTQEYIKTLLVELWLEDEYNYKNYL